MNYDEPGEHLNKHHLASFGNLVPPLEKSLLKLSLTEVSSLVRSFCVPLPPCACMVAVPQFRLAGRRTGFPKNQNRQHLENTNARARGGYSLDLEISSILNQNRLFRDGRCHVGPYNNKNSRSQEESE